jgi:hypothetical protein
LQQLYYTCCTFRSFVATNRSTHTDSLQLH